MMMQFHGLKVKAKRWGTWSFTYCATSWLYVQAYYKCVFSVKTHGDVGTG